MCVLTRWLLCCCRCQCQGCQPRAGGVRHTQVVPAALQGLPAPAQGSRAIPVLRSIVWLGKNAARSKRNARGDPLSQDVHTVPSGNSTAVRPGAPHRHSCRLFNQLHTRPGGLTSALLACCHLGLLRLFAAALQLVRQVLVDGRLASASVSVHVELADGHGEAAQRTQQSSSPHLLPVVDAHAGAFSRLCVAQLELGAVRGTRQHRTGQRRPPAEARDTHS